LNRLKFLRKWVNDMNSKKHFTSKKVVVLVADDFEDSEVKVPVEFFDSQDLDHEFIGVAARKKHAGKHDHEVETQKAVMGADIEDYAGLLIPGGHAPDSMRLDKDMVSFVRSFCASGKPVAAICHGPQLLIEAGVVRGKTMTSWPSVATDLKNAGANWVDKEVVVDGNLITSRKPGDLDAFCQAFGEQLSNLEPAAL
jgi:protease I